MGKKWMHGRPRIDKASTSELAKELERRREVLPYVIGAGRSALVPVDGPAAVLVFHYPDARLLQVASDTELLDELKKRRGVSVESHGADESGTLRYTIARKPYGATDPE